MVLLDSASERYYRDDQLPSACCEKAHLPVRPRRSLRSSRCSRYVLSVVSGVRRRCTARDENTASRRRIPIQPLELSRLGGPMGIGFRRVWRFAGMERMWDGLFARIPLRAVRRTR